MKTILKSLAAFLMCAFAFTSCSSDDEPKNPSLDKVVTHIESVVNSHLGELYANEAFDQDYTYQVPGDNGRIHIKKDAEEGSIDSWRFR